MIEIFAFFSLEVHQIRMLLLNCSAYCNGKCLEVYC